jgi:hypothetical protein
MDAVLQNFSRLNHVHQGGMVSRYYFDKLKIVDPSKSAIESQVIRKSFSDLTRVSTDGTIRAGPGRSSPSPVGGARRDRRAPCLHPARTGRLNGPWPNLYFSYCFLFSCFFFCNLFLKSIFLQKIRRFG